MPTVQPLTLPVTQTICTDADYPRASTTPTVAFTSTPDNTPIPQATMMGGGLGQIAFASDRTGVPQIYLINIDGTD